MKVPVASFAVKPCGGRLVTAVGHRGWVERRGIMLTLCDDRGTRGLGEAVPLEAEELTRVRATLPDALARIPPMDLQDEPRQVVATAAQTALEGARVPPSGVWALETALFDLLGRRLGISVSDALRGADVCTYDDVEVNGLLGPLEAGRGAAEAEALVRRGILTIKAKIGSASIDFETLCGWLGELRRTLPHARLRLDANGAWSAPLARQRLQSLARFEPELCEQPTAPDALGRLGATAVPWFADESLEASHHPDAVLAMQGLGGVVIKPPRVGGMLAALHLAEQAQARGLPVIVTHSFDGPIGLAASCELALALPRRPMACGLDRHDALGAFGDAEILQRRVDDRVLPSGRPGLGLDMSC